MEDHTAMDDLLKGIWRENPVLVQLLGLCPTLAVTNSVANALGMGVATVFVLLGSSILVSSLRKVIPGEVRITSYILIIATFVTVAEMALQALVPEVHKALGAFVALIVVNCIILGRQEAFSARNTVARSALDAIGMGAGFTLVLVMMGALREVLGSGTFLGVSVFGPRFEPWVIMVLPPGGFLTLGVILLGMAWWKELRAARARRAGAGAVPAPAYVPGRETFEPAREPAEVA
jgi:Na+-translocating ferredoxin:NAD+ oxidoreductase subunit E